MKERLPNDYKNFRDKFFVFFKFQLLVMLTVENHTAGSFRMQINGICVIRDNYVVKRLESILCTLPKLEIAFSKFAFLISVY